MAFLDNSGDIILDAVLTDTGRYRLAKADGSFRVAKFALGDDEINYGLYDKNNASGSSYYDLSILQTPILEAFTNNSVSLKSKLITVSRNDLLFMPVLKLSTFDTVNQLNTIGSYLVSVDQDTENKLIEFYANSISGHIYGRLAGGGSAIRVDQGIDSVEISPAFPLSADLKETQYIIEMDNRLGSVRSAPNAPPAGGGGASSQASLSYLDDDQIASYFFSLGTDNAYVVNNPNATNTDVTNETIRGPRGTVIKFALMASQELNTSTFLFDQLGSEMSLGSNTYLFIDTTVRVIGATTGYRIDIPVRFLKLK